MKLTYEQQCTKYFLPLDEIAEALNNGEGISGLTYIELKSIVERNSELKSDLKEYENFSI
jgi:hypothetical protein